MGSHTAGTIICDNPISRKPELFLKMLESRDGEIARGTAVHTKIAEMLHLKTIKDGKNTKMATVASFQKMLKDSITWCKASQMEEYSGLWQKLREEFDTCG